MQKKVALFISAFIFMLTINSVNSWTDFPIGNTFFWWLIQVILLISFFLAKKKYYNTDNNIHIFFLKMYLFWNIICIVRGIYVAEDYWEWKNLLSAGMVLLLPLSIYFSANTYIVQKITSQWVKYVLPAYFLFMLVIHSHAVGNYLVPISFLFLFFPLLTSKWKIVMLFFFFMVLLAGFDSRSNIIKFTIPLLLSSLYYLKSYIKVKVFSFLRFILLFLPIVLFITGITNTFNVFKMSDYLDGDFVVNQGGDKGVDLTSDTRTLLYVEVIASALKHNYMWFGRTPARGNDSDLFGKQLEKITNNGKKERSTNEVSILNIFTWTGLIGVFLYFLIFFKASYLAIRKSNSWFMQLLGVYISFRWCYAWVEDFSRFDLSYLFLWICIGMCFSKRFRQMSNWEFKNWVRGIFDKRYKRGYIINTI